MVLMPPGSAKSTYVSILFRACYLAHHPGAALIMACHTDSVASHFGHCTRILAQEHLAKLEYKLTPDERGKPRWRTNRGGDYFGPGIRGPITGRILVRSEFTDVPEACPGMVSV
jgi:hypothetical protein